MRVFRSIRADRLANQLITMTDHEGPEAQKAISKLAGLGDAAVPKVIEAIVTADKGQTVTFVEILTQLLNQKSQHHYLDALRHPSQRVVSAVAWALTSNRDFDPNALIELLQDPDVPKSTLLEIMSSHKTRLNARRLLQVAYDLPPNEKGACMTIVGEMVDDSMLDDLVERVSGKDPMVRAHIIKILSRFNRPDVQHALQGQLRDKSKLVREAALSALSRMGHGMSVDMLCNLLRDPEVSVQDKAVDVLVRLNHPDTMKHLVEVLKDENEYARRSAVEVLNEIGTSDNIKELLQALQDDDWWVRSRATDALAKIGGPRVVDAVVDLIKDDDEQIRRAAIEILNTTNDERAIDFLISATQDPDWWVRERAVDALVKMEAKSAVPALVDMLQMHAKSIPVAVRGLADLGDARVIKKLLPLLARPEKDIRIETMQALNRLANQTMLHPILSAIEQQKGDEDPVVREHAERAVVDLNGRFSQSVIAENAKAERVSRSANTLLIDNPEQEMLRELAETRATLDLGKIEAGEIIENRYKYIERIGKGAFGTVILVEDTVVDERLVLKFLNQAIAEDAEMMQRFVHELRYSRKITHKNVIRIYDFLHLCGLYAISMEYFPSHTLGGEIKNKQPLEIGHALRISADIANGMAVAHQVGIVHRDLKPANILINDEQLVKVVDFGVAAAHSSGDTQLTKTGYVIGSPKYMAPEQILGKKVDQRSDIYSLGVILYELLTGKPPYTEGDHMAVMYQHVQGGAKPVKELNPAIPDDVNELVKKTMAIDKLQRFQTMNELREQIENIAG